MRKLRALLTLFIVFVPLSRAKNLDPAKYPVTVTIAATKENTLVAGSASTIVCAVIGDIQYTLQANPRALLGTFRARITNNRHIDILIVEPSGHMYNLGTKILEQQRISPPPHLWSEDEKSVWEFYSSLPQDDKKYVQEFCTANPTEKAQLPHAKVPAGQPPDRSIGCSTWLSATDKFYLSN